MSVKQRIAISLMSLSATAFVGIAVNEGYVGQAMIPTRGDVPTLGLGSTTHADGSPVRMGERTTPVAAMQRTLLYVQKSDADIKRCVKSPLLQVEYDLYSDFMYQYGAGTFCSSSIAINLNAQKYAQACESLLLYKKSAGYDCSTPGNHVCSDVWGRQLRRHATCVAAQ